MKYPSEFPRDARTRVEAETLRAYSALEQEVRGVESSRRDVPFIRCVMRIFLAFVRNACAFGRKGNHPAWSDSELDRRCRDFLLSIVVDAWEDKAKDLGIRKMFSSPHHWGNSLDDDARRKIESSPEWRLYQELLLEAFDVQSARATDCKLPQPEPADDTAPGIEAMAPTQPVTPPGPQKPETKETIVAERNTVPGSMTRRHGFQADMSRHNAIAHAVKLHSPKWRPGRQPWRDDSLLRSICADFDQGGISIPTNWRAGTTISLKGVKLKGWVNAWELGYKKHITDQIHYSLGMVLKKTTAPEAGS
jgi:hypothetical protein